MEEEMRECYYDIFREATDSLFIVDKKGIIIRCNEVAKSESGYGKSLLGQKLSVVFPSIVDCEEESLRWLNDTEDGVLETVCYRKNQTCYPVKVKVIPKQGESISGVVICTNFTEQKEAKRSAQEALKEMESAIRLKTQFIANITHELRTPVNGMKGMAENLLDTNLSPSQQETVSIIIRSCNNMSRIINDILDVSKLEAGKLTIEHNRFNFRKFLDETMTFHLTKINEKGLKLIANVSSDVPTYLIGDELRLGQVINNLISNAIKFTSVGYIALEVAVNQRTSTQVELFFMVIDTGIGISEEEKRKLFKSFSQVDDSITRRYGGSGLGLYMAKELVGLMGGSIRVESEKNKGSNFSFTAKFLMCEQDEEDTDAYPHGRYEYNKKNRNEMDNEFDYRILNDSEELVSEAENTRTARDSLEKMILCMELGTWEKAEEFAGIVKNMISSDNEELRKKAFRLELNVRKENYDKSMELAKSLLEELS